MRATALAALFALAGLAGCSGNAPAATFQTCPAWSEGLSHGMFNEVFGNSTPHAPRVDTLGAGLLRDEGRPLDRVGLDFHARSEGGRSVAQGIEVQDARLEARFHRRDDGKALVAYDAASGPRGSANPGKAVWEFPPGVHKDFTLYVDLSEPGQPAGSPTAVDVEWTFARDLDDDARTTSQAFLVYTASYQYRLC